MIDNPHGNSLGNPKVPKLSSSSSEENRVLSRNKVCPWWKYEGEDRQELKLQPKVFCSPSRIVRRRMTRPGAFTGQKLNPSMRRVQKKMKERLGRPSVNRQDRMFLCPFNLVRMTCLPRKMNPGI